MLYVRRGFQIFILLCVLYLAFGFGSHSFEHYCPFGGLESMYSLVRQGKTTCATGPWNFAMFFAVLGLTLVAKKSFCSWICPVGFCYEMLGKGQQKLFGKKSLPPQNVDRWLRYLRYVVLVVVLYFTWTIGDLVFRGYDPYYLIFTGGMGHETLGWVSVAILMGLLISGLVVRMSWCRYLCPLSAIMDGLSYISPVGVQKDAQLCISCGKCDRVCDHDLRPSSYDFISHVDCSNCLNCVEACPEEGAMSLVAHNPIERMKLFFLKEKPNGPIVGEIEKKNEMSQAK